MQLEEFESYYRSVMQDMLNQLQTLTLLTVQLETEDSAADSAGGNPQSLTHVISIIKTRIFDVANSIKRLSLQVEEFIEEQKA